MLSPGGEQSHSKQFFPMKELIELPQNRDNIVANLARWYPLLFHGAATSTKGSATRFLANLTSCAPLRIWRQAAREFQVKLPTGTVRKDQTAALVIGRLIQAGVQAVPIEDKPKNKKRKQT